MLLLLLSLRVCVCVCLYIYTTCAYESGFNFMIVALYFFLLRAS